MPALKLQQFTGIFPRIPDSMLPESAASVSQFCEFAYGELRGLKGSSQINTLVNSPRSIYTDDGLRFFTWTTDTDAVRSPLVSDTFNRVYYTNGTSFRVANRSLAQTTGGPPSSSYAVGVPRPTVAPTLQFVLPTVDTTNHTITPKFHYEYGGIKYQETTLVSSIFTPAGWTFTAPVKNKELSFSSLDNFPETGEAGVVYKALDTDKNYVWNALVQEYGLTTSGATPVGAVPVLRVTAVKTSDQSETYDLYSESSSFTSSGGLFALSLTTADGGVTFTASVTTAIKEEDKEARAYVYTYVNTYNEEGPPSPPTVGNAAPGVRVDVTCNRLAAGSYAPFKEIRIYRTPTGSTIADYFYVGSIAVLDATGDNFTFVDTVSAAELNEPLSSLNNYPPPADLVGLMSLPNGILAAWRQNELWFSDAYRPWAWNPSNVKPLAYRIVGGIPHGSGAVITTVGSPFIVSGVSPDSMTASRLNVDQAGVSKWSIAVVNGSVMFASNDGIVTLSGASGSLAASERFFTREVWRDRYGAGLSGMRFAVWDGRLLVFSGTAQFTPFLIRFDESSGTMTDMPGFFAWSSFVSPVADQLYTTVGTALLQFSAGVELDATWESREVVVPKPMSLGILQSVCTGTWTLTITALLDVDVPGGSQGTSTVGPWTVTVGANSITAATALTAGTKTLRIPPSLRSDRFKFRLFGKGRFRELRLANSGSELATL